MSPISAKNPGRNGDERWRLVTAQAAPSTNLQFLRTIVTRLMNGGKGLGRAIEGSYLGALSQCDSGGRTASGPGCALVRDSMGLVVPCIGHAMPGRRRHETTTHIGLGIGWQHAAGPIRAGCRRGSRPAWSCCRRNDRHGNQRRDRPSNEPGIRLAGRFRRHRSQPGQPLGHVSERLEPILDLRQQLWPVDALSGAGHRHSQPPRCEYPDPRQVRGRRADRDSVQHRAGRRSVPDHRSEQERADNVRSGHFPLRDRGRDYRRMESRH
jgi:hypothetical protein